MPFTGVTIRGEGGAGLVGVFRPAAGDKSCNAGLVGGGASAGMPLVGTATVGRDVVFSVSGWGRLASLGAWLGGTETCNGECRALTSFATTSLTAELCFCLVNEPSSVFLVDRATSVEFEGPGACTAECSAPMSSALTLPAAECCLC